MKENLIKKRKVLVVDICDEYRRYNRLSDTEIIKFCSDKKAKGVRRVTIFNDKEKKRSLSQMYDIVYKKIFRNFTNGILIIENIKTYSTLTLAQMQGLINKAKSSKNTEYIFTFQDFSNPICLYLKGNKCDIDNLILFKLSQPNMSALGSCSA